MGETSELSELSEDEDDQEGTQEYHNHLKELQKKSGAAGRAAVPAPAVDTSKARNRTLPAGFVDLDSSMSDNEDIVVDALDRRGGPSEMREDPEDADVDILGDGDGDAEADDDMDEAMYM